MPTPALTASIRYTDQAATRVYWVPSIAAPTLVPTRAELNAGTDLTGELVNFVGITGSSGGGGQAGWTFTVERINTQNLTQTFNTEIAGSLSVVDPSLTLYASKNGTDVRNLLSAGASGNVVFCDGGDTTGNRAQVFPVSVAMVSVVRSEAGRDATKLTVSFVITGQPAVSVALP